MEKRINKEDYKELLGALLNCGSWDIDSIVRLWRAFDVDITSVIKKALYENGVEVDANTLIYYIYDNVLNEGVEEIDFNEIDGFDIDDYVTIYTNYLDSHLYINGVEGDESVEVYDYNDLLRELYKLKCKLIEREIMGENIRER